MLAVLTELFIVKNCYKFGSPPSIMHSLVLTLLSWTQKLQRCLQLLGLVSFTISHWKGIQGEHSCSIAHLNTQTLPPHLIDLDRLLCLAVNYNFRHTCCYVNYHKPATFYACFSMIYFFAFVTEPLFMLINVALWCPSPPKLTGILRSLVVMAIARRLELLITINFV